MAEEAHKRTEDEHDQALGPEHLTETSDLDPTGMLT